MTNKKKETVKKSGSGLERLNRTKEIYQSGASKNVNNNKAQQGVSSESIEDTVRRVFQQELPKLIKNGNIDAKSLMGNNGGVNNPIGTNNELIKMMDILSKNNTPNTQNTNQNNIPNNNNQLNQLKMFMELSQLINPPQQNNQQGNNKATEMILAYLLKQKESGNDINSVVPIITQMMQLNEKANNYRMEALMSRLGGNGEPREDPQQKLMKNFQFFREISGDKRTKNKDEMEYDIKKKELELKEFGRRDMLDREERQKDREDAKSERIIGIGGAVLDKVIGNGLGALVGDLMSVKGNVNKGKGKPVGQVKEDFDPSLLDDL